MNMIPFGWFDLLLGVIILASVISGLRPGFARVVVGLAATVVGFLAGFWCYRLVAAKLMPVFRNQRVADLIGFFLIFVGVLIVGSLLAALLARLFQWIGLSWFDHLLGGAAGLVRGALVAAVIADVVIAFAPWRTPEFLQESRLVPYASGVSAFLAELAPRELKDAFNEQMQNLKRLRETPAPRQNRTHEV
jgi:membrane protein required for colicin V production